MTIDVEVELFASARDHGLAYVASPNVGLVSIVGKKRDWRTSLTNVTAACVERLQPLVAQWSTMLPEHRFVMLAATSSQLLPNVLAQRRGIWGSEEVRWLNAEARRSPTIKVHDVTGTRFAGLAEVPGAQLSAAADYVRRTGNGVIIFSNLMPPTEEQAIMLYSRTFPSGGSSVDWASVVDPLPHTDDIVLNVYGGFDDREVALYAMMSSALMKRLGSQT